MKIFISILLTVSILVIALHSGCITNPDDISITLFAATPAIIEPGENTTIKWIVLGATEVFIEPLIGSVDLIGNQTLTLNQTTTFTLTASTNNNTVKKTIEVVVEETGIYEGIIIDDQQFSRAKRDPLDIINVTIRSDIITFDIGYSGGCENHTFSLIGQETFMESEPVQIHVVLSHDDKDDACDAYLYETLVFDLSDLKQNWQNAYQQQSGAIILNIENYTEAIRYQFGQALFSFLNVTIQTNKNTYGINETIEVSILVENMKNSNVTLEFPNSQVADFNCINDQGETVYLWSYERGFAEVITPLTIPSESIIELFNFTWSRMSNAGMVLDDGMYQLQGWLPGFYYQDESIDHSSSPGPRIYSDSIQITFI